MVYRDVVTGTPTLAYPDRGRHRYDLRGCCPRSPLSEALAVGPPKRGRTIDSRACVFRAPRFRLCDGRLGESRGLSPGRRQDRSPTAGPTVVALGLYRDVYRGGDRV